MQTKLTDEQTSAVDEYRERYFQQAVSTAHADKESAEKAALRLAEIAGVKIEYIEWRNSPDECDSLSASLSASFSASLSASLRYSLWYSLSASLRDSLSASLSASLWDSLSASLRDSLSASLSASLRDSLSASLWDTGWITYYTYCVEVLGVEINDKNRELLHLYNEIVSSCFAVWIVPGTVIFLDRPASVEVKKRKLTNIEWR